MLTDKKLVVIDIDIPNLLKNKIFQPELSVPISHTFLPLCYLFQEAKKRGIDFITPDIFFSMDNKPSSTLCISFLYTPFTDRLLEVGVNPVIVVCTESPFIATRFYLQFRKISQKFKYSFVFSGMKDRVSKRSIYRKMYFPSSFDISKISPLPFGEKKFTTMISSDKSIKNWKKDILLKVFYGSNVKQIYSERMAVIDYFSGIKGFDLFGRGWDTHVSSNVKKVYKGEVEDKHEILRKYKFVFAYENSIFPGYVTEKIFDVFFAGAVPIYLGAPDIEFFVPKECFIDRRDFSGNAELNLYLRSMSCETYGQYIVNIRKYLTSAQYSYFTQEYFAKSILDICLKEFEAYG